MGVDITIKERKEFRCPDCGAKMDGGDGNSAICSKTT